MDGRIGRLIAGDRAIVVVLCLCGNSLYYVLWDCIILRACTLNSILWHV